MGCDRPRTKTCHHAATPDTRPLIIATSGRNAITVRLQ